MIVLTGGFHWSSLSTYLPTIYLPIIYLIYLSTYLSLVSFLWKKKKTWWIQMAVTTEIQLTLPNSAWNAKQSCSFEEGLTRCAVFSQPKGVAEPEQRWRENYRSRVHLYLLHCVNSHPSPCPVSPGSHTGLSADSSLCGRSLPGLYGMPHGQPSWYLISSLPGLSLGTASEN